MTRALAVAVALLASGCSPLIGLVVRAAQSDGGALVPGGEVRGSTRGAGDRWQPACGAPAGGGDRAYVFIPPESGTYQLDVDADYDSVLAVFDADGGALECNDDHDRTTHSRVVRRFEAGQRYTVVVDGYRGATGGFTLRVTATGEEASPPDERALPLDGRRTGDTSAGTDTRTPSCGATEGSPDETWLFTPPETGRYQFDLAAAFDGVLAVYAPDGETPLECNDDHGSTRRSQVIAQLEAGRAYSVVVDGYQGATGRYRIAARRAAAEDARALRVGEEATGDTTGGADGRTPPCGARAGSPDDVWVFVPPRSATYVVHLSADYDGLLAVYREGVPEPIDCNDDAGATTESEVRVPLIAGQRYEVVVDGWAGRAGAYRLRVDEAGTAGGGALTLGREVRGNTAGGTDHETPSCGASAGSADEVWTFTPTETQLYQIDVTAQYDSVLAVLDANGQELACNDDHGSTRASQVQVTMTAGQTYRVVVDGYRGQAGSYSMVLSAQGAPPPPPPPAGPRVENITALEARCGAMPTLAAGVQTLSIPAAEAHARTSCGAFGPGAEGVRRIRVSEPSRLQITAESPHEPVLELRTGCSRGHRVVACDATANRASRAARLEPNVDYTLVVDTRRGGDASVRLEVQLAPIAP